MGYRGLRGLLGWALTGSLVVPGTAGPEGALCDPVKMVFTDPS
jgi:hypothetical protein